MTDRRKIEEEMRQLMDYVARRQRRLTASELHRFHRYLARLFKTYRETHNLTEEEFAKEIDGPVTWVRRIEAEAYKVTLIDVFWIAKFFNIHVIDLIKDGGFR